MSIEITIGMSIKKFKLVQEEFLNDLAQLLNINREDIEIVSIKSAKCDNRKTRKVLSKEKKIETKTVPQKPKVDDEYKKDSPLHFPPMDRESFIR